MSEQEQVVAALRAAGARFAFVHGSRARGDARQDSDLDVAAWWPGTAPTAFEVDLPRGVDLLVLNTAPLELAGRVALEAVLLYDDAPDERVGWLARTRKIWSDERYRFERSHREFAASLRERAASRGR